MGTTFPGNALMYRSITNPLLWQIAYALIIAAEGVTGALFLAGAIRLFQVRNAPGAVFNAEKSLVIAASLLAFLVWFFGFMVVAGEWFAMWQSTTWNGQDAAFRFYMAVLAVLIFVYQPDGDLHAALAGTEGASAAAPETPKRRRTDVKPKRRRTDRPESSG
jgi:predicted small integral membrane protein